MAAVLVVALLIPFPFWAIPAVLVVLAVYTIPILIILILDVMIHRRVALGAILLLSGLGWMSLLSHGPGGFLPTINGRPNWINWANFAVRPIHLVGPIILARHFWRKKPINSGLILWGWMGIVSMGLPFGISRASHGYRFGTFDLLIEFARLTAVFALSLMIYGKRPASGESSWTYYLGWGLAEYDAILWGCYSLSWLLAAQRLG